MVEREKRDTMRWRGKGRMKRDIKLGLAVGLDGYKYWETRSKIGNGDKARPLVLPLMTTAAPST